MDFFATVGNKLANKIHEINITKTIQPVNNDVQERKILMTPINVPEIEDDIGTQMKPVAMNRLNISKTNEKISITVALKLCELYKKQLQRGTISDV